MLLVVSLQAELGLEGGVAPVNVAFKDGRAMIFMALAALACRLQDDVRAVHLLVGAGLLCQHRHGVGLALGSLLLSHLRLELQLWRARIISRRLLHFA